MLLFVSGNCDSCWTQMSRSVTLLEKRLMIVKRRKYLRRGRRREEKRRFERKFDRKILHFTSISRWFPRTTRKVSRHWENWIRCLRFRSIRPERPGVSKDLRTHGRYCGRWSILRKATRNFFRALKLGFIYQLDRWIPVEFLDVRVYCSSSIWFEPEETRSSIELFSPLSASLTMPPTSSPS